MIRRASCVVVLVALLVFGGAVSATAWNNGGDDGNGYGSHDWILERAIRIAASDASWVNVPVALRASDDPDSARAYLDPDGPERFWHVYKEAGPARGAAHQVAVEFEALMDAYEAGDYRTASVRLGVLSHYFSDVAQPFHTVTDKRTAYPDAGDPSIEEWHSRYEDVIGWDMYRYSDSGDLVIARDRAPVADVRAATVAVAAYARERYPTLLPALAASWGRAGSDPVVRGVTREVMTRSVNDLADIIAGVPRGRGRAARPATVRRSMLNPRYYYPRIGQNVGLQVTCVDGAGRPIEGARVEYVWPAAGGEVRDVAYTDAAGVALDWQVIDTGREMARLPVTATTALGPVSLTCTTTIMQTPVLADGTAGVRTTLSTSAPRRGDTVRARTVFRDVSGRPVAGLPVTFTWYFKSGAVRMKTLTDATGAARVSRAIGQVTRGYRVYVKAEAFSGGHLRSSRASFVPK